MDKPIAFQTIGEYLSTPFGNESKEKEKMHQAYLRCRSKISVEGFLEKDGNYLVHLTVPSESNKDQVYDVVILFFTDNPSVEKGFFLDRFYVKFFSNSPSFIYQYAVLYHTAGFLIDFLFEKMDKEYTDVMPKNPKPLSYDKSLYCACQYLAEPKFDHINMTGILRRKKKNEAAFFRDIKSFENVKMTAEMTSLNKKIDKEMKENRRVNKEEKKKKQEGKTRTSSSHIVTANTQTSGVITNRPSYATRKTASQKTSHLQKSTRHATKKSAKKTTIRNPS